MKRKMWLLLLIFLCLNCFSNAEKSKKKEGPSVFNQASALSLRVLQQRLLSSDHGIVSSEDVTHLGGITRICGYVIDDATHDVILVGDSDPSAPPLYTDDFILALRNAFHVYDETEGNTRYYSYPGCSIDPDPEVFRSLQKLGDLITSPSTTGGIEEHLEDWHNLCQEPQQVRVMGIPFDSRFGQVMVKADYDMKTLVDGSDDSLHVPGFQSLTDLTLNAITPALIQEKPITIPISTMNRFWFYPGENKYLTDEQSAIIEQCPVKLLSEEQYLEKSGNARGTGRADPLAQTFCDSFTVHYGDVAKKRPIYTELENLFRLVAVAKLMEHLNCMAVAGLNLNYLIREYPVGVNEVDRTLPGRSNVKEFSHRKDYEGGYSEIHLWLPSCGGVSIELDPESKNVKPDRTAETLSRLKWFRMQIIKARPHDNELKWKLPLESKTDLEHWEKFLKTYAFLSRN